MSTQNDEGRSQIANDVLTIEDRMIKAASAFDLKLLKAPDEACLNLLTLPSETLAALKKNLETTLKVFEKCSQQEVDPWDDREFFRIFMREVGVMYLKDFLDQIDAEDVIEGYALNHVQIFRNMRFMEISGYSLIELLSSSWKTLYDRPSSIEQQILASCSEIWEANGTIPFKVPPHFIREVRSREPMVAELTFKKISPLYSGPNRPFGMLGSSSVRVIGSALADDNLNFI